MFSLKTPVCNCLIIITSNSRGTLAVYRLIRWVCIEARLVCLVLCFNFVVI